jgi:hypothetical protein
MNESGLIGDLARQQQLEAQTKLLDQVILILRKYNPLGLDMAAQPEDYRPEANSIAARIRAEGESLEGVRRVVHEEFVSWRGADRAGAIDDYTEIARDVRAAAESLTRHQERT